MGLARQQAGASGVVRTKAGAGALQRHSAQFMGVAPVSEAYGPETAHLSVHLRELPYI